MKNKADRGVSIHWECAGCGSHRFMAMKARPWSGITIPLTPRLAVELAAGAEFNCRACGGSEGQVTGGDYLSDDDLIPF
jgi:hypothetical protein